jgi:hypothetical protein
VEYLDRLAEEAVKQAIKDLRERNERPSSKSVPPEARKILLSKGRNRVSPVDAEKRVQQAIARMKDRKEIRAPSAPYNDWALVEVASRSAPEPS